VIPAEAVKDAVDEEHRQLVIEVVAGRARLACGDGRTDDDIADDEGSRHWHARIIHGEGKDIGGNALTECLLLQLGHAVLVDQRHGKRGVGRDVEERKRARSHKPDQRLIDGDLLLVVYRQQ
jgi:hypothetical protein